MMFTYLLYTLCQIIMVMTCLSNTYGYNLTWEVDKQVFKYGDDVSLFCKKDKCCLETAGWIKWTSRNDFTTLFIDVKDLSVPESSKYSGKINRNGFFLVIRKVTREDFNVNYSCTYGFHVSKKRMLLETDAFVAKVHTDGAVRNKDSGSKQVNISTFWPWIAVSVAFVWVVAVAILAVCFKDRIKNAINGGICSGRAPSPEMTPSRRRNDQRDNYEQTGMSPPNYDSSGEGEPLINQENTGMTPPSPWTIVMVRDTVVNHRQIEPVPPVQHQNVFYTTCLENSPILTCQTTYNAPGTVYPGQQHHCWNTIHLEKSPKLTLPMTYKAPADEPRTKEDSRVQGAEKQDTDEDVLKKKNTTFSHQTGSKADDNFNQNQGKIKSIDSGSNDE